MDVIFRNVSFGYGEPLLEKASFHLTNGWSAVVGANGSGKSTLLRLALGMLDPDAGEVIAPEGVCCEQRCDRAPDRFAEFLSADDGSSAKLAGLLAIGADWNERWGTLSFGERKRAQIAAALWRGPALLALDEPTNHLDRTARLCLIGALARYRGVGIIVSHDRELLDSLPYQCLHLDPPRAVMRPGTYSEGKAEAEREEAYIREERRKISANISRLEAEASVHKGLARSADRLRSKKGIGVKDHDAKEKNNRARVTGKDAVQGKILRGLYGRIRKEEELLSSLHAGRKREGSVFMPDGEGRGGFALRLDEGEIRAGSRIIRYPQLMVRRGEKIALTGDNGAGKTTLLRHIGDSVRDAVHIPQEMLADEAAAMYARIMGYENDIKGRILTAVEVLGTDAKRLLRTSEPSPGEIRKLMIAEALEARPDLLLMDEPTNHMDLRSVECLEKCLSECRVTMILVSHDRAFIEAVTGAEWTVEPDEAETSRVFCFGNRR